MDKLKQLLRSDVIHFVVLRYATMAIQFMNAIVIADLLGAYYFGIFSFISLLLQYLSYSNFGISYSLNVYLSLKKNSTAIAEKVWGSALTINHWTAVLIVVILGGTQVFSFQYFDKYNFSDYWVPVALTAILVNYNSLYMNASRVHGKLRVINLFQILPPVTTLALFPFFKGAQLLDVWVWINMGSNLVALVLFINESPYPFTWSNGGKIQKILFQKGVHLLLYNMSFYFITIGARTVISVKCSVEELGYYSFANSIANSAAMAGAAFVFVFFPKILNRFHTADADETRALLIRIKDTYVIILNTLFLICVVFAPLLPFLLPQMRPAQEPLILLLASQVLLTTSTGMSSMLIAKKQETKLTPFGFQAVIMAVAGAFLVISFGFSIEAVAFVIILVSLYYTLRIHNYGLHLMPVALPGYFKANYAELITVGMVTVSIGLNLPWLVFATLPLYIGLKWQNFGFAISEAFKVVGRGANQF